MEITRKQEVKFNALLKQLIEIQDTVTHANENHQYSVLELAKRERKEQMETIVNFVKGL